MQNITSLGQSLAEVNKDIQIESPLSLTEALFRPIGEGITLEKWDLQKKKRGVCVCALERVPGISPPGWDKVVLSVKANSCPTAQDPLTSSPDRGRSCPFRQGRRNSNSRACSAEALQHLQSMLALFVSQPFPKLSPPFLHVRSFIVGWGGGPEG